MKIQEQLVYSQKHPNISIYVDKFQWILQVNNDRERCYFPTLQLLLDELAERIFRNNAKTIKTLAELGDLITEVYALNTKVSKNVNLIAPNALRQALEAKAGNDTKTGNK